MLDGLIFNFTKCQIFTPLGGIMEVLLLKHICNQNILVKFCPNLQTSPGLNF